MEDVAEMSDLTWAIGDRSVEEDDCGGGGDAVACLDGGDGFAGAGGGANAAVRSRVDE